jgi:hypothetical protein
MGETLHNINTKAYDGHDYTQYPLTYPKVELQNVSLSIFCHNTCFQIHSELITLNSYSIIFVAAWVQTFFPNLEIVSPDGHVVSRNLQ